MHNTPHPIIVIVKEAMNLRGICFVRVIQEGLKGEAMGGVDGKKGKGEVGATIF